MHPTPLPITEPIEAAELRERLERGEPVFVLDVRPASDANDWWIPGRTHVDAYDALWAGDAQALAGVSVPAGVQAVTVCGRGNTSLLAAEQLRRRGIDARSLHGGMKSWSLAWNTAEVPTSRPDVTIVQVRRTGKGCLSYLIASGGEAAVVDASVPVEVYQELARRHGWRIRAAIETHVHADHLWRGPELARREGATLHLPRQDRVAFKAEPMDEGTRITLGRITLSALRTPGHTPESTTLQVADQALLTGDTLFLDSVGRPDLKASDNETRRRAILLRASLERLGMLDPALVVLPGHTGQPVPFDGQPLAARLGDVRARVEWFELAEAAFVEAIVKRIPAVPANHRQIIRLNETGLGAQADAADLEVGGNRCAAS